MSNSKLSAVSKNSNLSSVDPVLILLKNIFQKMPIFILCLKTTNFGQTHEDAFFLFKFCFSVDLS